jgi:hypothetical protein
MMAGGQTFEFLMDSVNATVSSQERIAAPHRVFVALEISLRVLLPNKNRPKSGDSLINKLSIFNNLEVWRTGSHSNS